MEERRNRVADKRKSPNEFMQNMAHAIDIALREKLGRKIGFALLLFDFDAANGIAGDYVSNAERGSMIRALRESADRLEQNQDISETIGSA